VIEVNELFKALSDPTRRSILEKLNEKDLTAGEIAEYFNISKPSISHHLSILKNAGVIEVRRDGQKLIYSLNVTVFQNVMTWIYNMVGKEEE
jgi:DNA-binding transcriptional ArsR family regulator